MKKKAKTVDRRNGRAARGVLAGALFAAATVHAEGKPVLHEPIPPNPKEDLSVAASIDGDLPAAIETRSGIVAAPDPRRPADPPRARRGDGTQAALDVPRFLPDRDTRQPDVVPYEDPFTPSTAPFKRLAAFDSVDASYALFVADERFTPVPKRSDLAADGSEEPFFADLVVEADARGRTRIPSVAPGARVVRASLMANGRRSGFRIVRDGAENWFLEVEGPMRGRLVMEVAAPRASFGGEPADSPWSALPAAPKLPANVQRTAGLVAERIGVSRAMRPRQVTAKLVDYFRSFVDTDEPLADQGDIYLDLALSKKGVCRHRAFAFLVTALSLGLPTRVVMNEAHAWVEVHDGHLFRRIDLGGAGRALRDALGSNAHHETPLDPFGWPPGAGRGEDLASRARSSAPSLQPTEDHRSDAAAAASGREPRLNGPRDASPLDKDRRPRSVLRLSAAATDARRSSPLALTGSVHAEDEPCPHVTVEIALRSSRAPGQELALGVLATNESGEFQGALVVPRTTPLGEYEVVARTRGDGRCGRGVGP